MNKLNCAIAPCVKKHHNLKINEGIHSHLLYIDSVKNQQLPFDRYVNRYRYDFCLFLYFKELRFKEETNDFMTDVMQAGNFHPAAIEKIGLRKEAIILYGSMIVFRPEFLEPEEYSKLTSLPLFKNLKNKVVLTLSLAEKQEIDSIINKIITELEKQTALKREMMYAYVRVLMVMLSRIYNLQYENVEPIKESVFYNQYLSILEDNFKKKHLVRDYAAMLNMTENTLNKLIKHQSGKTALIHINDRILLEAKMLINHTEKSVKEVAYELGFSYDSYFSRFFKRMTGVTPSNYRLTTKEFYN